MIKAGIDHDAIVKMFSEATTKQGEALRKAVADATLKALQGRELTMENIKKVLKSVTSAASTGAAQNVASPVDVEALLTKAFAGMDNALLQAVEANRKALQQFVDQGTGLQEKQLKGAIANIEKMEDTFFATVTKAAETAGGSLQGPWEHVLSAMKMKGTDTGAQATQTVEQLMAQAQASMREGRAATAKTAQAMLDGYAALVSGVLIGMSEGLQSGAAPAAKAKKK
jgi:primosomal protein N''